MAAPTTRTVNAYAGFAPKSEVKPWQYESRPLGAEDVEIKISHCGICGSDIHTLDSGWGPTTYPCVVGHEIIGEVTFVGSDVKHLAVGDRVGVGAQVWACLNKGANTPCQDCVGNTDAYCPHAVYTYNGKYKDGSNSYGGYADYVRVSSNYTFKIPDNIPSDVAAPLMCAGATVFTPLKRRGVKAGDRVGVIGIGGLGHLAIQFINALDAIPVAFSRSANKKDEVLGLGAAEFYNLSDPKDAEKAVDSVDMLLVTANADNMPYDLYLSLIRRHGTYVMLAVPEDKVAFNAFQLIIRDIKMVGSLIGSIEDIKDMLTLAAKKNVRPIIQKLPMSKVNDGIELVRSGKVRYRVVLEN